jgi:hypothetical protein
VWPRRGNGVNSQGFVVRSRKRRQFTNGRRQTATRRPTWSAIAQGEPKICPRTFPSCLSAKVATLT